MATDGDGGGGGGGGGGDDGDGGGVAEVGGAELPLLLPAMALVAELMTWPLLAASHPVAFPYTVDPDTDKRAPVFCACTPVPLFTMVVPATISVE